MQESGVLIRVQEELSRRVLLVMAAWCSGHEGFLFPGLRAIGLRRGGITRAEDVVLGSIAQTPSSLRSGLRKAVRRTRPPPPNHLNRVTDPSVSPCPRSLPSHQHHSRKIMCQTWIYRWAIPKYSDYAKVFLIRHIQPRSNQFWDLTEQRHYIQCR